MNNSHDPARQFRALDIQAAKEVQVVGDEMDLDDQQEADTCEKKTDECGEQERKQVQEQEEEPKPAQIEDEDEDINWTLSQKFIDEIVAKAELHDQVDKLAHDMYISSLKTTAGTDNA